MLRDAVVIGRVAAFAVALACALTLARSPAPAPAASSTSDRALQVSFDSGASVRLRGQRFASRSGTGVAQLNTVIDRLAGVRVRRVFRASEQALDAASRRLRRAGGHGVPDLNRHFRVIARDRAARDALLRALDRLPVVDDVIAEPEPSPPPLTPNFAGLQGYAGPAPAGIGTAALNALPGGLGEQVKIVDIEYAWNPAHEDLAKASPAGALIANGTPADPFSDPEHGTAVLGQLIGTANGLGVTGLSPNSEIAMVNAFNSSPCDCVDLPQAVLLAQQHMTAGDVMLIEQQHPGLGGSFIPVEYWPAVYDAIRVATQAGIIVVEAAGNGGGDLDDPDYGAPFPDGRPDSGAIVVGAGSSGAACAPGLGPRDRLNFSTYGSRVNLQGWGNCVTTAGYGDLFDEGSPNSLYTEEFGGTSSAAPIVAAAAARYSSTYQATQGTPPSPQLVRSRLIATGTPQGAATAAKHIGPLPDLAAAAADFSTFALTIAHGGSGSGAVSSQPAGIACGATCTAGFAPGTPVTLTATPAAGSRFAGWTGSCSAATTTCTLPVNAFAAVTASFDAVAPAPNAGGTAGTARAGIAATSPRVSTAKSARARTIVAGLAVRVSRLKPGSRVVVQLRYDARTLLTLRGKADRSGAVRLTLRLSGERARRLRNKRKLSLRYSVTDAGRRARVVTRPLRIT